MGDTTVPTDHNRDQFTKPVCRFWRAPVLDNHRDSWGESVSTFIAFAVGVLLVLLSYALSIGASKSLSVKETLAALGKGPTLGSASAPVTLVEFSDFQCSFCKKFWADTLPKLTASYVQQGQVQIIYRHFAILGKFSEQAAMAADCAGEQGKFWQYHDQLFANQGGFAFTHFKLEQYARALELNSANFKRCLTSEKYRKKVEGETAVAASLGARGTPTFFVNGRLMVGAQPINVFQNVINEELISNKKK